MNFLGHVVVARWQREDPPFLLGAMLPDLANMARGRLLGVDHDELGSGVSFHHRTDDVFHRAPTFVRLWSESTKELEARGARLGPARAVGHVGVEFLLDGVLLERNDPSEPYLRAVEAAAPDALGGKVRWRRAETAEAFEHLRRRLLEWGRPTGYDDAATVADRLERVLAPRPRLALTPEEVTLVEQWASDTQPRVAEVTGQLLDEVRDGLERATPLR